MFDKHKIDTKVDTNFTLEIKFLMYKEWLILPKIADFI